MRLLDIGQALSYKVTVSDLEFKHEQEIKHLNRQVSRLKSDLGELNTLFTKTVEEQQEIISNLSCVIRATNISTIASLQAVQQDLTSRMSILLDMIRYCIPDDRLNTALHETQEKISALTPADTLRDQFAKELERRQADMELEALRIINEHSKRNSK
jgi:light-regulated signal transduction histidine kinase (bacteriophytochrome)